MHISAYIKAVVFELSARHFATDTDVSTPSLLKRKCLAQYVDLCGKHQWRSYGSRSRGGAQDSEAANQGRLSLHGKKGGACMLLAGDAHAVATLLANVKLLAIWMTTSRRISN